MFVYQLQNKVNDKKYIGITTRNVKTRLVEHVARAKKYGGQRNRFYAALNKYGLNNFDLKVLTECKNKADLEKKEIEFIDKLKPEYNLATGGNVGAKGFKWTQEQLDNVSKKRKGLLAGIKNPMYGKKGKLNPMSNPEVYAKWVAAMEKRGYNMRKAGN